MISYKGEGGKQISYFSDKEGRGGNVNSPCPSMQVLGMTFGVDIRL